jgi:MFS family permease
LIIVLVIEFFCLPKGKLTGNGERKKLPGIPGNVMFLGSIGFLFYAFIAVYNTNISMLVTQRSFGATAEASYASMSYTFAGMLAGFAVGKIMDRLNHRTIPFSLILSVLGLMICVLSTNLIFLCIGGMLCGAAFSIFTPAGNYYAVEKSAPDQQAFHISLFSSASNLGMALSPILIGTLSALLHTGITIKFVLAALVCALLSVIAIKKYREKQ